MRKPAKKVTKVAEIRIAIVKKYQRLYKFLQKIDRKSGLYTIGLILAGVILLTTSVYAAHHASDDYSTNSNAHMLTYLFSGHTDYPAVLPGPHATLLIIPLVYIQGHLPYHYSSFTLVNIALVVATMFGWALLMIKLFGRKYEIPILIILSSLIFTSVAFSYSLAYTTIRNIEYPLVLWFVMIVASVLKGKLFSRKQLIWGAIGTALFVITLAGDSFFNYAILLPLVAVLGWYWVQSRLFTASMAKALALIVGSFIGATLLKHILSAAGIITFDYSFWGPNTVLDSARLVPSFSVALRETLQMHGAYIFNQIINYHNMAVFVNFGLLLVGLVGLGLIISKTSRSFKNQKGLDDDSNFVLFVMAISFFVTFLVFAISGYAIATLSTGQIVSAQNARYISIMPLITMIAIVWLLKNYYAKHITLLCVLCLVLIGGIITSHPAVKASYASGSYKLEISPSRDSINQIIYYLKKNNVTQVSTDYWYSYPLRFWSNGTINNAAVVNCTPSMINNADGPLFTKQKHNTALIIDRGERNYGFWQCSDEQLMQVYGAPSEMHEVQGAGPNEPVKIWIYKNAQ